MGIAELRDIARSRFAALLEAFPTVPRAPAAPPATVRDIWFPQNGKPVVLLRWLFTEWCNYRCPYCPQTHDRRAPRGPGLTAHGFDNFPVEQWIDAFDRHFTDQRLSLVMTGGESMIDRKNMTTLLNHLSAKPEVECIRIDTNAWWKPEQFADLDFTKIMLMCTFHPSQTEEGAFKKRIASYLKAGYQIGMVNYVMDDTNRHEFARRRREFAEIGATLHPNPLWGGNGQYGPEDLALMEASIPEFDFGYRSGAVDPFGKQCLFPALSYEMDLAGQIYPGCLPELTGSFFDEKLPQRPTDLVPCPFHSCVCLDKYSFLEGFERNVSTNPFAQYSSELKRIASQRG